jgi:hypothetical protein
MSAVTTPIFDSPYQTGEILQPVGHEERHRLAAAQVQALAPVGEAVGHGVELAIGDGAALEGQGGSVAPLLHGLLHVVADQVVGVGIDRFHPRKRAVQSAHEAPLAFELCLDGHPFLRFSGELAVQRR